MATIQVGMWDTIFALRYAQRKGAHFYLALCFAVNRRNLPLAT